MSCPAASACQHSSSNPSSSPKTGTISAANNDLAIQPFIKHAHLSNQSSVCCPDQPYCCCAGLFPVIPPAGLNANAAVDEAVPEGEEAIPEEEYEEEPLPGASPAPAAAGLTGTSPSPSPSPLPGGLPTTTALPSVLMPGGLGASPSPKPSPSPLPLGGLGPLPIPMATTPGALGASPSPSLSASPSPSPSPKPSPGMQGFCYCCFCCSCGGRHKT